MAILTSVSRILLIAKANTTDAERKMKKLSGTQREMAKAAIEASGETNEALESNIIRLGKVAIGVGVVMVAFKGLAAATKRFAVISQKEFAATGADIGKVQNAARGLITRYEALSFAAAGLNSDFKLNQAALEITAAAFVNLRNEGNALNRTLEGFTKAVVEGNVRALREFGIIIDESSGSADAFNAAMDRAIELSEKQIEVMGGDEALRAGVQWADAMDDIAVAAGKLGAALSPVVSALAFIIGGTADILTGKAGEKLGEIIAGAEDTRDEMTRIRKDIATLEADIKRRALRPEGFDPRSLGGQDTSFRLLGTFGEKRFLRQSDIFVAEAFKNRKRQLKQLEATIAPFRSELQKPILTLPPVFFDAEKKKKKKKKKRQKSKGFPFPGFGDPRALGGTGAFRTLGFEAEGAPLFPGIPPSGVGLDELPDIDKILEQIVRPKTRPDAFEAAITKATGVEAKDFNESTTSKIEKARELQKELKLTASIQKEFRDTGVQAAKVFQQAGVQAFDAWITGAKGVGQAIKESIGGSLRALATDMFGRSLFHGAMALAALAMGGPTATARAAKHGKAAAAFAGGAVVVGGLAKALGGGAAPGGGAGGGTAPGGGGGGDIVRSSTVTVFVGEDFGENRRQSGERLARAFRRAREAEGGDEEFFLDS